MSAHAGNPQQEGSTPLLIPDEGGGLAGDWLWVWDAFIEPSAAEVPDAETEHERALAPMDRWVRAQRFERVPVPKLWHQIDGGANQGSGTGHATYVVELRMPVSADGVWTLAMNVLNTAGKYRLYDSRARPLTPWQIHGQPGMNPSETIPLYMRSALSFSPPADQRVWALVQVAGFHHPRSGIGFAPEVGPATLMMKELLSTFGLSIFTIAVLIIAIIYHLIIFSLRRDDQAPLWFSALCLVILSRELVLGYVIEYFFVTPSMALFQARLVIEYMSVAFGPIVALFFIDALLPIRTARIWIVRAFVAIGGLGTVAALVLPAMVYTDFLTAYQLFLVGTFIVFLTHLIVESSRGTQNAIGVLLGAVVLIFGAGHDILSNNKVLDTPFIAPYTFLTFILIQSLVVARNYTRAIETRDQTQKTLLETYQKLDEELLNRERLIESNNTLQREMDDASKQLIQADKMSTLGSLVAGVAHDIAGPTQLILNSQDDCRESLESLRGMIVELFVGEESDEGKKLLSAIETRFDHLSTIGSHIHLGGQRIKEIHGAIRNQARTDEEELPFSLETIVAECLTITNVKLKFIEVERVGLEGVQLRCIRSQMSQVLTNLISNAADALSESSSLSSAGGGNTAIRVSFHWSADGGSELSVEDSGPGVPPERAEKIWEPFFTTKSVNHGTGLGMPIVKRIIERHGFEIRLSRSESLGGARFTIVIPPEAASPESAA